MSAPDRLVDLFDEALDTWAAPARPHLPLATFCAEAHPLDPAVLCRRLDGHSGLHAADECDTWPEETP